MSNPYPKSILHALTALALLATPATATDWYVSPIGDDTADGTSETPFATIQHAIDVAAEEGDIVWLNRGTYTGDGNRDIEPLGKSIYLRSVTGVAAECVIDCQGTAEEPHIGFHVRETWDFTLMGVTIRNAWTDSTRQGAIYLEGTPYAIWETDGFAMPAGGYCRAWLSNVSIVGTHGTGVVVLGYGAGLGMDGCKISGSSDHGLYANPEGWSVRIGDSRLQNNGRHGIMTRTYAGVRLWRNTITDNAGAGIMAEDIFCGGTDDHMEISECDIRRNGTTGLSVDGPLIIDRTTVAENGGGGVISLNDLCEDWWITNCRILDNDGDGVRMRAWSWHPSIRYTEVLRNHGNGLTMMCGVVPASAENCLIADNKGHGVVLRFDRYSEQGGLKGCTVAGNRGAGVFIEEADTDHPVTFERAIIAFNGGAALLEAEPAARWAPARTKAIGVSAVTCTDIYGNQSDWTGPLAGFAGVGGNMAVDPAFCDEVGYELMGSSPCAGENSDGCGLIGARGVGCAGVQEVAVAADVPGSCRLVGAYPNPFNPVTRLVYELAGREAVDLRVYDLRGRLVRTLVSGEIEGPGRLEVVWRGKDDLGREMATGVYLWQLEAGEARLARRVTLVR